MFGEKQQANPLGKFGQNAQNLVFPEEPACAKCMPNMTYKQRLYGFGACFGLGWLLSFMGTMTLIGGPTSANISAFVALYVCGNVVALCATGFLLGPRRQCAKMWHPTRRYSTAFFLIMLIIVFAVAVAKQHVALVLFLLIIEILAAIWYSASYIPFGRAFILKVCRKYCLCCMPCFAAYDQYKLSFPPPTTQEKIQGSFDKLTTKAGGGESGGDKNAGWLNDEEEQA